MPTLCAYIMLHNEEHIIIETLEKMPIIDGPVVLVMDTKSTDRTEELAKQYLEQKNKAYKIVKNEFIDYAQQRNFALDYCKDLADFTIFIDAGDFFKDSDELVETLRDKKLYFEDRTFKNILAFSISMNISGKEAKQACITINSNSYRYKNKFHEYLFADNDPNVKVVPLLFPPVLKYQNRKNNIEKVFNGMKRGQLDIEYLESLFDSDKPTKAEDILIWLNQLIICYNYENQYKKTIQVCFTVLDVLKQMKFNEEEEFFNSLLPYYLFQVGRSLYYLDDDKAIDFFNSSLKYTNMMNANCLIYLARHYMKRERNDDAENVIMILLSIDNNLFDWDGLLWAEFQNIALNQWRFELAREYCQKIYYTEDVSILYKKMKQRKKDIKNIIEAAKTIKQKAIYNI